MLKNILRQIFGLAFTKYHTLSSELKHIAGSIFCKRKVIVISEKGISSIPVSSKLQGISAMLVLLVLLWISFSTGKYVTSENVIAQKDREIWSTNATNEGLQYQMADLHNNLADLNKYFENIKQLDQFSQKNIEKTKGKKANINNEEVKVEIASQDEDLKANKSKKTIEGIQQILTNIRGKVISRINSLENIIDMTGLNVKKISANNHSLRDAFNKTPHLHMQASEKINNGKNQGGPYYPADNENQVFNQEEFEAEIQYLMQLEKTINSIPLSAPLKQYVISSSFGRRIDPILHGGVAAMHTGMDLSGEYKSKVYSSAPGVVTFAEESGAYGRLVQINHGSGIETRYGHLDRILVREGETVKRGQLIGLQGNTGRSTGAHLHYEVRLNNEPINPANFLEAGRYVF